MENIDLKAYLNVEKAFNYKQSTVKEFTHVLLNTQRFWKTLTPDGDKKPRYTARFAFINALSLHRGNWKTQLRSDLVQGKDKKLKALNRIFDLNQELLIDNMIENGQSYRVWLTTYANEYVDSVENNNKDKIVIEIKGKTNKLKVAE